jgi:hypothetical protein
MVGATPKYNELKIGSLEAYLSRRAESEPKAAKQAEAFMIRQAYEKAGYRVIGLGPTNAVIRPACQPPATDHSLVAQAQKSR